MKKIWNTYFYWNRTERRGVIPLLVFLGVLICVNVFLRFRTPENITEPDAGFMASAKQFEQSKDQLQETDSSQYAYSEKYTNYESDFSPKVSKYNKPSGPFNPNDLSVEQWVELGLSEKQAASIGRFQEKGGKFYKKEDLKKMYVISEEFYANIEPFVVFEKADKPFFADKPYPEKISNTTAKIDINKADSAQLISLKGITPKMAQKILSVRKTFGGFHSLEQVNDLYGFYEPNYARLSEVAFAGPITIKPVNLNYCTFKELLQVPGLEYETVKNIMNHRQRIGSFKKTEDLVNLNLAEPDLYAKIAPYLTVK